MTDYIEGLRNTIVGMVDAFSRGENVMAYARARSDGCDVNDTLTTLIAYDLQSGTYIDFANNNQDYNEKWCAQVSEILSKHVTSESFVLEVGCGEATTLAGSLAGLKGNYAKAFGFDISWSRLHVANQWLDTKNTDAKLFVSDLFEIPLEDNSIDVVYTSHSLEPNGGREKEALKELLRVSSDKVVLIEPMYELASDEAQERMLAHGYVRGLKAIAESLGAKVLEYKLLDVCGNKLNPSGLLVLEKEASSKKNRIQREQDIWRCPITNTSLSELDDVFVSPETGMVYPILRGVPMLRSQHGIVASKLLDKN